MTEVARARRSRAQHFAEEAEKCTRAIHFQLDKLEKLANRTYNEYASNQVDAVFGSIRTRLEKVERRFERMGEPDFSMPQASDSD